MKKETWTTNCQDEVEFWRRWCKTEGEIWHDNYLFRMDRHNKLQEQYHKYVNEHSLILDCGSGMYSVLGRYLNGKRLTMECIDALADQFIEIRKEFNLPDIDLVKTIDIENLNCFFQPNSFNFVHAQNCLDHSYDPLKCFANMMEVCMPGGHVYTHHEINEGQNEEYNGLHQWNFFEKDNCFYMSNREGEEVNISKIYEAHFHEIIVDSGWITFIIKK
jgi:ubiquinone/menaquinone biosynthesis C-methylase UbiE